MSSLCRARSFLRLAASEGSSSAMTTPTLSRRIGTAGALVGGLELYLWISYASN